MIIKQKGTKQKKGRRFRGRFARANNETRRRRTTRGFISIDMTAKILLGPLGEKSRIYQLTRVVKTTTTVGVFICAVFYSFRIKPRGLRRRLTSRMGGRPLYRLYNTNGVSTTRERDRWLSLSTAVIRIEIGTCENDKIYHNTLISIILGCAYKIINI